jgi:TetR/AcrR family transcriptional regulator, tetracycline repressor protein
MPRSKRAALTRAIIVEAAIGLIGEHGLETFSMPTLASSLGVRSPSLYHHFADKDALLAEVARVVATPDAPPELSAQADWTDYLVAQAVALRRTIRAHPHCAPLLVRFMPKGTMFVEYEQLCRFLAASGVPPRHHVAVVDGMTALTIGAAFLHENAGRGPTPDRASHPALAAALDTIGDATPDALFASYLRAYLASILAAIGDSSAN